MTSEVNAETSEFLRRRKLRLQQVREQSKDIAKKIRQRAKLEKLRQVVELDTKKQKDYFVKQDKLVKKLEEYYSKGIKSVGSGHKDAEETKNDDDKTKHNLEVTKQRGKEAVAELRKNKQEKLDEQKRLLDRKLQAREVANELSREKGVSVSNKLIKASDVDELNKCNEPVTDNNANNVTTNDMGTQWDLEEPNEWIPNIPTLSLPKDDNEYKENIESKSDKSKRMDLFALSEEMPTSLRGGLATEERAPVKPSLTLVSEYVQNRGLRLRESEKSGQNKNYELKNLKQTILRTRGIKQGINELCLVHDEEKVPVPCWQPENSCKICQNKYLANPKLHNNYKGHSNVQINERKTLKYRDISPSPVLRGSSPFRRDKICHRSCSSTVNCVERLSKTMSGAVQSSSSGIRKNSVTIYNHSTRDTRDIPCHDEGLVIRDEQSNEDAYSQAMKASNSKKITDKESKKLEDMRTKVAMTKQSVEKEYRDTVNFLRSLPKDGGKPIRGAYMDEHRQEEQRENRQRKMQDEFLKIQRECKKHTCRNKTRSKSKTPTKDDEIANDFQYSWMPVPESDGNLAIHTIPTSLKEGKSNSVKFSKVDSYHEYRSRHKHTPPTKETTNEVPKDVESARLSFSETETSESETSSIDNIRLEKKRRSKDSDLSDAEKIIVYKILEAKSGKRSNNKLLKDILKQLNKNKSNVADGDEAKKSEATSSESRNKVTFGQVNEGIYKAVNQNGDNITTMYYNENENITEIADETKSVPQCNKKTSVSSNKLDKETTPLQWESGEAQPAGHSTDTGCQCCTKPKIIPQTNSIAGPSAATSTTSFKTAATNCKIPEGYVKLLDEGGEEAGKFYIGASGFVRDNAYEVVIQLRKKVDDKKDDKEIQYEEDKNTNTPRVPSTVDVPATVQEDEELIITESDEKIPNSQTNVEIQKVNSEISLNDNELNVNSEEAVQRQASDKSVAEKGVCTSFQESYAVPAHVTKADAPKPATSTYTQTSDSPPNNRPAFFHMSSSTSTAYMSPPDMILPHFLKSGYKLTDDDINDPRNYEIIDKAHEPHFKQRHECRRKCTKTKTCNFGGDYRTHQNNLPTPPNTANSRHSNRSDYDYRKEYITDSSHDLNKKSKHNCRKCKSRNHLGDNVKPGARKPNLHIKNSRSIYTKTTSNATLVNKNRLTNRVNKSKLNPKIKDYVNKLLELNRESLKAVQVMDQVCSPVPTPGSSIINIENNTKNGHHVVENKISLEQIKTMVMQQILEEIVKDNKTTSRNYHEDCIKHNSSRNLKINRIPRKKTLHKVKSLNISKNLLQQNKTETTTQSPNATSSSSNKTGTDAQEHRYVSKNKTNLRSRSYPTPRIVPKLDLSGTSAEPKSKVPKTVNKEKNKVSKTCNANKGNPVSESVSNHYSHRATTGTNSPESELFAPVNRRKIDSITNISTQTSTNLDSDLNFVKIAEDKIQNMEKIADLTEKCTQRLSNLAKVLEEVRKNKSLAYSQIVSDAASDSDQKSDRNETKSSNYYESNIEVPKLSDKNPDQHEYQNIECDDINKTVSESTDYVPFLSNIPKPPTFKPISSDQLPSSSNSSKASSSPVDEITESTIKNRPKPPPALSRIHLKHGKNNVIPHELSTVLEVDSPLSIKQRSQTSRIETKLEDDVVDHVAKEQSFGQTRVAQATPNRSTTDLLKSIDNNQESMIGLPKDSPDDSKMQMIDLKQFNEIMLKPFYSIHEYAKHCNIETLDDGSNLDDVPKDEGLNEELNSLHSDGSLPDVISELLKRNLITEPFKFDNGSNVNSTTVSSESTLSVLALSKSRKEKKKSSVMFQNKENIEETSDTLSISSNPDLESAFKKLGLGWASSTLKKTKERLALSSSSNTSSSSLSHFKIKHFSHEIPALVSDTVSSVLSSSKPLQKRNVTDSAKNAEQQTSLTNSMTVKEFLNNELAKKITFTNKSINETEEEFVSLFETKMPEEMKHSSRVVREEHSIDNSMRSGNNRARTSTPVQLFKSTTYHSSSSSNVSNGLFSNADEISSVKVTSNSMKHSTSDKDDLTIPNLSLKIKKGSSDCSRSD